MFGCLKLSFSACVGYKCKTITSNLNSPIKNIPQSGSILPPSKLCQYCGAIEFYFEPKGFCCCDGEISLVLSDVPDIYINL